MQRKPSLPAIQSCAALPSADGCPHTKNGAMSYTGRTARNSKCAMVARGCSRTQQVEQQRRQQRTVHDKAGVAFDLRDIRMIVVDAMAVVRQRGVAKQQHGIGTNFAAPHALHRRAARRRCGIIRPRQFAVDDVVLVDQRRPSRSGDLVAHFHEYQRAAAPLLQCHVRDARHARDRVADAQRPVKFHPAARPHPPRQRHRRQKAATLRMAIRTDLRHRAHRQEVLPVPRWWQRIAFFERPREIERRGKRTGGHDVDDVGRSL